MKPIIVLFSIILFIAVVSGRSSHIQKSDDENEEIDSEVEEHGHNHLNNAKRHTRHPRQSYYNPFYYDNRRDDSRRDYYNRRQDELISRILDQLEEISYYIKRPQTPPPPPQVIYVSVPYPMPQSNQCSKTPVPNITLDGRLPEGLDDAQIWGQTVTESNLNLDDEDGSRPIVIRPVETNEATVKPPPVQHGSTQAGMRPPSVPAAKKPGKCKAAVIVCCQLLLTQERRQCFSVYGCPKTFTNPAICHPTVVQRVIQEFSESYAPA